MRRKSILFILLGIIIIAIFILPKIVSPADTPAAYLESANTLLEDNDYEESIIQFKKYLEVDPMHTEARVGLAISYMGLSRFEDAIETLKEGIEIKPKEPQFYHFLSVAYEEKDDLLQVIETIEDGIDATDNTALKEQLDQLTSNIKIELDRHYVQKGHSRNVILSWIKRDTTIASVEADWKLSNNENGSLEKISDTIMAFHAEQSGKVDISASVASITKHVEIHIEDQVVEKLEITPIEIDPLSIDQEIQLDVSGIDANGDIMPIHPTWTTNNESILELSEIGESSVHIKTIDEGIARITVSYQELHKEMDLIIEGDNRFVNVNVEGEGNVTISPDKTSYLDGSRLTINATPNDGYEFVGWKGDLSGMDNSIEITLDSSISVTAVFQPIGYNLNLSITGEGNIIRDSLNSRYPAGESISLLARPSDGWQFSHWEGSVNSNTARIQVQMDQDKDIRAVFVQQPQAPINDNNNYEIEQKSNNTNSIQEQRKDQNSTAKPEKSKQQADKDQQIPNPINEEPASEEKDKTDHDKPSEKGDDVNKEEPIEDESPQENEGPSLGDSEENSDQEDTE